MAIRPADLQVHATDQLHTELAIWERVKLANLRHLYDGGAVNPDEFPGVEVTLQSAQGLSDERILVSAMQTSIIAHGFNPIYFIYEYKTCPSAGANGESLRI